MMADDLLFTEDEVAIDEGLGYPKAYSKLCRDRRMGPYRHGPPYTFTPYVLQQNEACGAKEFEEMFPIIDPKAKPTAKPKIFVSLLWKQLNHLGNAGFDPATFRVDPYGNVLYYHADSASPLAWEIDHWFPCSRGGLTVPSNLRILQWQVCKKKNDNLEFLIPWWDLQLGISINQFLTIFASSNSDFRRRAFSLLFSDGESEEINASQTADSHNFPSHFVESKEKLGLAPAAIVFSSRESFDSSSALRSLDLNRRPRSNTPILATRKSRVGSSKENENPDLATNPYQAIVMARDSLRHRDENTKLQGEMHRLDEEVNELKRKTEDEKVAIQELELVLIKRRRRAEKCRKLAEAQSSYRTMLEKMIRDAMHQNVIYKEQVRLNQAAANALKARLEAQKAICDSSEKDLYRKFKQRDELESRIRPEGDQHLRKRSRMDNIAVEEGRENNFLALPSNEEARTESERELNNNNAHIHKELRVFLEEEQRAYEAKLSMIREENENGVYILEEEQRAYEAKLSMIREENENGVYNKMCNVRFPGSNEEELKEDEECRKKRGKGTVEKWLQMLLEDHTPEEGYENDFDDEKNNADQITSSKLKYPQKEIEVLGEKDKEEIEVLGEKDKDSKVQSNYNTAENGKGDELGGDICERIERRKSYGGEIIKEIEDLKFKKKDEGKTPMRNPPYTIVDKRKGNELGESTSKGIGRRNSFEWVKGKEKKEKEKNMARSESFRAFRRIPSSPSLILKKGVDYCIRRKPSVIGDDDVDEEGAAAAGKNSFIKSSIKTIKKAVKI